MSPLKLSATARFVAIAITIAITVLGLASATPAVALPPLPPAGSVYLSGAESCDPLFPVLEPSPLGFVAFWNSLRPRAVFSNYLQLFDPEGAELTPHVAFPGLLADQLVRDDGSIVVLFDVGTDFSAEAQFLARYPEQPTPPEGLVELPPGEDRVRQFLELPDGSLLLWRLGSTQALRFDETGVLGTIDLSGPAARDETLTVVGDELWGLADLPPGMLPVIATNFEVRRYALDGTPLGNGPFYRSQTLGEVEGFTFAVDGRERGHLLVHAEEVARIETFTRTGAAVGAPRVVAEGDDLQSFRITPDAEGNLLIVWRDTTPPPFAVGVQPSTLYARSVLADGTLAGPERLLTPRTGPGDMRLFDGGSTALVGPGRAQVAVYAEAPFLDTGFECASRGAIAALPVLLAGERHLLLQDGRFRVEVDWQDPFNGGEGIGHAVPGTRDSGSFWFFSADTKEIEIKILDGRTINDNFWVFAAGLSNVGYRITVTDQRTGRSKTYVNPPREYGNFIDTTSFPDP